MCLVRLIIYNNYSTVKGHIKAYWIIRLKYINLLQKTHENVNKILFGIFI